MDQHQKQLSSMDPSLKEAYEKVMNSPVSQTPPPTASPMQPPTMQSTPSQPSISNLSTVEPPSAQVIQAPSVQPIEAPSVTAPSFSGAQPNPVTSPIVPPAPSVTPPVTPAPGIPPQQTVHIDYTLKKPSNGNVSFGRKKLGVPPVLYIVGCILFFVLYTFFWLRVFGLPIPYLG